MNIGNSKDQLLIKLMSASTLRYRVLTNNLTNQNTPGYTRKTVEFEDLLSQELQELNPDLLSVEAKVRADELTPGSPDGNNVNPELELNGLLQNRMQYELYSTLLAGRMELLRSAIEEGR
jgi:flagellar basal-body rod protein FlgB